MSLRIEAGDYVQCLFEKDDGVLHQGGHGYVVCRLDAATHRVKADTVYVVMGTGSPTAYPVNRVLLTSKASYAPVKYEDAVAMLDGVTSHIVRELRAA